MTLRGKTELSPQKPGEESEQIKGKERTLGLSRVSMVSRNNTGSHSTYMFNSWEFNSMFIDVLAWGKGKGQGREKKGEREMSREGDRDLEIYRERETSANKEDE